MRKILYILPFLFLLNCCSQNPIPINGSGNRIPINGSGTPISIINVVPPAGDYYSPQSGNITFTDDHFQDAAPGVARTNFTQRNPAAYVEFRTSETDFSVKVGGNWSGQGEESKIYMLVDGVYTESFTLTADDVTQTIAITTLSAGVKIIKLVCGYAAVTDGGGDLRYSEYGTYVQGVVTTGDIEIKVPVTPTKRIVCHGMSISTGASGTRFTLTGWIPQMKADYHITMLTYGAAGLCDNPGNFSDAQADQLVAFDIANFGSSTQKEIWLDLHTNDWAVYQLSKAFYKSYVEKYIDKIHAADASVRIIYWRPTARTNQATPNVSGAILQDFIDAVDELQVTRSSWFFPLGALSDGGGTGNTIDGLHLNQTGHDAAYTTRLALYQAL